MTVIGQRVRRIEDGPLLRGRGRFADDIDFVGQLHMRVVRSPVAFGWIDQIEAETARATAGSSFHLVRPSTKRTRGSAAP